jgi:hypothetical protein
MSSQFFEAVKTSHQLAVKAEWYIEGVWTPITLVGGSMSADYYSLVMRTFGIELAPSVSTVQSRERLDTISPTLYGTYVRLWRGVTFPDSTSELAPLGVYVIERFQTETGSGYGVSFGGSDLYSMVNRARLESPRTVKGPSRIEVCKDLIREALEPNLPWGDVIFRVLPGVVDDDLKSTLIERDRGTAIRDILTGAGIRGYFAADGAFEFSPQIYESKPSVWTLSTGDTGTLISVQEATNREKIYNIVVAIGESNSNDEEKPPVSAVARDTNPDSPTYWQGPFGKVPYFYSSQFITTEVQAQTVANALLPTVRGAAATFDVSTSPNPALVPGDVVTVIFGTEAGVEVSTHMISSFSVPLVPAGEMGLKTQLLKTAVEEGGTRSWPPRL